MAERLPVIRRAGAEMVTPPAAGVSGPREHMPRGSVRVTWTGLLNTDTGKGVQLGQYPFKMAYILGTFGAGGELTFQGSNNSTNGTDGNWFALTDPQGNPIAKTGEAVEAIQEHPIWIRPAVTGGDGTTDLTAELSANKE